MWFGNVREKIASMNWPVVRQKAETLWVKIGSVQLMGGLKGGKPNRLLCGSECMVQEKSADFFSS
jgi:hypothetical protein